ncbi:MAG: hypothetical protein ACXWCK_33600 [Burkholderiales bacterium]
MRVTRIAGDANDIGATSCRVWINEVEVLDWTVADDFRRVVETSDGPRFGSVRIEVQPEQVAEVAAEPAEVLAPARTQVARKPKRSW